MYFSKLFAITCLLVMMMAAIQLCGCADVLSKDIKEGRELSKTYCQSCHQYPEPGLLNRTTWSAYVLPKMGRLMGFGHFQTGGYVESGKEVMTLSQWNKIVNYYVSQSREFPGVTDTSVIIPKELGQFSVEIPAFTVKKPATTLVSIDTVGKKIYFADGLTENIYTLSQNLRLLDSIKAGRGVSNIQPDSGRVLALSMGVLHPSDEDHGMLVSLDPVLKKSHTLLPHLQRAVHASYADLDGDGLEDIVICEFGNNTGRLSWFDKGENGLYTKHVLRNLPGAVKTEIFDFNSDGRPDIMALMAQGDEGMFIYYNQGGGIFKEDRVLQMSPSYGSNYFELSDINKDGHPDIIATNGDNGDYPPILKPYHGIRIYLNNGSNRFKEKTFIPVNGVGKAIARDFDEDGDLDIASIAYFPDYENRPEEAFIYWKNSGRSFSPSTFPQVSAGRWLTMDAGDADGDGDLDIILGNTFFSLGNVPERFQKQWEQYTPSVLILKNMLR